MKILAIDTACEACSAALLIDDAHLERHAFTPRAHAGQILPMVESLLLEAGIAGTALDALAFDRGPGAFTSVRIGAGVVQGLALAWGLPVAPISSLATLAQGAFRETGECYLLPAIDARMQEIYWGCYGIDHERRQPGLATVISADKLSVPEDITVPDPGPWHGIGTAWGTYEEQLLSALGERLATHRATCQPMARDVAILGRACHNVGQSVDAAAAVPVYLRDNVASVPKR